MINGECARGACGRWFAMVVRYNICEVVLEHKFVLYVVSMKVVVKVSKYNKVGGGSTSIFDILKEVMKEFVA